MMAASTVQLPPELAKIYKLRGRVLGTGGFGKVLLGEHKPSREKCRRLSAVPSKLCFGSRLCITETDTQVAIKVMNKAELKGDLPRAYREVEALKELCHQHICQLYQFYEDSTHLYLILEYVSGGELFDYIVSRERLDEKEARALLRQMVSALAFIHAAGYAHRDLKPENMLLDETRNIKFIDFGLCSKPSGGLVNPLNTCCGSPAYAAPELISGKNYLGNEVDVWSLGVILYALLCGFLPFDDDNIQILYQKIKRGVFDEPEWLSTDSKRLLHQLLQVDPLKRITLRELLSHEWVMKSSGAPVKWQSSIRMSTPDPRAVHDLAIFYKVPTCDIESKLLKPAYDDLTAHYLLTCRKLSRMKDRLPAPVMLNSPAPTPSATRERSSTWSSSPVIIQDWPLQGADTVSPAAPNKPCEPVFVTPRRPHPPVLMERNMNVLNATPVTKNTSSPLQESKIISASADDVFAGKAASAAVAARTPRKACNPVGNPENTPFSMRNKAPGILDRLVGILTPKKGQDSDSQSFIKDMRNIHKSCAKSSTELADILEGVLSQLQRTGYPVVYEKERFVFRCRVTIGCTRVLMELEICSIPYLDGHHGIHIKRLRGDSWTYKKVCETILDSVVA